MVDAANPFTVTVTLQRTLAHCDADTLRRVMMVSRAHYAEAKRALVMRAAETGALSYRQTLPGALRTLQILRECNPRLARMVAAKPIYYHERIVRYGDAHTYRRYFSAVSECALLDMCRWGNLAAFRDLASPLLCEFSARTLRSFFRAACNAGQAEVAQYVYYDMALEKRGGLVRKPARILQNTEATGEGFAKMLRLLKRIDPTLAASRALFEHACASHSTEALRELVDMGFEMDSRAFTYGLEHACRAGDVRMVRELRALAAGLTPDNTVPWYAATRQNQAELFRELRDAGMRFGEREYCELMLTAVQEGRTDLLRELHGMGVSARGACDAMFAAIRCDDVEIFRELMRMGLTLETMRNNLALHHAVSYRRTEFVREMLAAGMPLEDLRTVRDHKTPLYIAAQENCADIVRMFREAGLTAADVRFQHDNYENVLSVAVRNGHLEVVKELLLMVGPDDVRAIRPEALAVAGGRNAELVRQLLAAGLTVDSDGVVTSETLSFIVLNGCVENLRVLRDAGLTVEKVRKDAHNMLRIASAAADVEIIRELRDMGVTMRDVRQRTPESAVPLLVCAAANSGDATVVRELVGMGLTADDVRQRDCSALLVAVEGGCAGVVRELVNTGLTVEDVRKALEKARNMWGRDEIAHILGAVRLTQEGAAGAERVSFV